MGTAGLLVTTHRNDAYLFVAPPYAKNRVCNVFRLFYTYFPMPQVEHFGHFSPMHTLFVEEKMYA